jgi:hypothetical protein
VRLFLVGFNNIFAVVKQPRSLQDASSLHNATVSYYE